MKRRTDWLSIGLSVLLLMTLVAFTLFMPEQTTGALEQARVGVCGVLGFYFLLLIIACLVFCIWAAFSKYGAVRMGREAPEYKTFNWITMIFCSAMGTSILYWSAIEWAYYLQQPPMGLVPFSGEAAEVVLSYSFFHWGIPPWSVSAVGVIPLAYRFYVRRKNSLSLPVACAGVIGEARAAGWLGRVINVVFVFGMLGGLAITYGTGIPMLANNLGGAVGTGDGFAARAVLVGVITVMIAVITSIGLKKGMQRMSSFAAYASILLCVLFLVLGDPLFTVENTLQSLGQMLYRFIPMLTNLDAVSGGTFTRDWTVFYWAWWVCLAPWSWIFVAKISRGRSIRSVIAAVVLAGSAGSVLFFGAISNYGLKSYLAGALDAAKAMQTVGVNQLITDMISSLPIGKAILILWFITGFLLLVNTMSSASFSLSTASTRGIGVDEEPPRRLRIFWAVMLAVAPLCLLYAGQFTGGVSLGGLQAVMIMAAVPVSVTVIFAMISGVRWLREDYGHMTKAEIRDAFLPL